MFYYIFVANSFNTYFIQAANLFSLNLLVITILDVRYFKLVWF